MRSASAPAGPASSSSSGRSRTPISSAARPSATASGRPRHLYDVTADAQDLFPSNYDALASGLLAAIEAVGGDDLLDQVFAARRRQLGQRVREQMTDRLAPDAPLVDRVRELAVIQADNGYLADAVLEIDGTIRLREHNCAIFSIAKASPAACQAELELFSEVLGADVVRESHIASGDRCCTYRITENYGGRHLAPLRALAGSASRSRICRCARSFLPPAFAWTRSDARFSIARVLFAELHDDGAAFADIP